MPLLRSNRIWPTISTGPSMRFLSTVKLYAIKLISLLLVCRALLYLMTLQNGKAGWKYRIGIFSGRYPNIHRPGKLIPQDTPQGFIFSPTSKFNWFPLGDRHFPESNKPIRLLSTHLAMNLGRAAQRLTRGHALQHCPRWMRWKSLSWNSIYSPPPLKELLSLRLLLRAYYLWTLVKLPQIALLPPLCCDRRLRLV